MLSRWPIRRKLWLCIALLAGIIMILAGCGLRGVYAYRRLAKSLSQRANELPLSLELVAHVSALSESIESLQGFRRSLEGTSWVGSSVSTPHIAPAARQASGIVDPLELPQPPSPRPVPHPIVTSGASAGASEGPRDTPPGPTEPATEAPAKRSAETTLPDPVDLPVASVTPMLLQSLFEQELAVIEEKARVYHELLDNNRHANDPFGDSRAEREALEVFRQRLAQVRRLNHQNWTVMDDQQFEQLGSKVRDLRQLADALPSYLHDRMLGLSNAVRLQYRTWIGLLGLSGLATIGLLLLFGRLVYVWIFQPLNLLILGSQRVASGDFQHQIQLRTHDEMAGLAQAMNHMVRRFREIRANLDRQVRERTREVVRSEQMASVGFLAAGVAHEINNPLASIALCAESLEERLHDIIQADDAKPDEEHNAEIDILRSYLKMMQDEAFRCKQITERLLDFSRLGDLQRQDLDLNELIETVIEMIKHLGKYKHKHVKFSVHAPVVAHVCGPEIKQVILNLITNGLDSLEPHGTVHVELTQRGSWAELVVQDDGCGMTEEVIRNIFEPFYTRRRDGQGTGLGLSITYRIVHDHGGSIQVSSDGPSHGSRFVINLPLQPLDKEQCHLYDAAA